MIELGMCIFLSCAGVALLGLGASVVVYMLGRKDDE